MDFSNEQLERYSRHIILKEIGVKGQKKLLDACADYVKPGGVLMYATCTISKRENEEQAKAFMERNGCFEKGELSGCLPKDMWKRLYEGFMLQLFPHTDGTEGFFLAKMIRR